MCFIPDLFQERVPDPGSVPLPGDQHLHDRLHLHDRRSRRQQVGRSFVPLGGFHLRRPTSRVGGGCSKGFCLDMDWTACQIQMRLWGSEVPNF